MNNFANYIPQVLCIVAVWGYLFIMFIGIGLLFRRSLGFISGDFRSLLNAFWVGWGLTIFFIQIWHLFLPVNNFVFYCVSIVGFVGAVLNAKSFSELLKIDSFHRVTCLSAVALVTILLAYRASLPYFTYDSGLYHFNAVRWAKAFSIVPGIGNLHGRLAFNNSYFLYVALLEVKPWIFKAHHFASGLLLWVFFLQIISSAISILGRGGKASDFFWAVLLFPSVCFAFSPEISSPSLELPSFVLMCVVSGKFFEFLQEKKCSSDREYCDIVLWIVLMAFVVMTIRFNLIFFAGPVIALVLMHWNLRKYKDSQFNKVKMLILFAAFLIVGIAPWIIRNVILSGYPLFPSPYGAFPVEWRMPRASVLNLQNWIMSWARAPGVHWKHVLGNWNWFDKWLGLFLEKKDAVVIPLFISSLMFFLVFCKQVRGYKDNLHKYSSFLFFLPTGIFLIFWFFTAPDVRFAAAAFWILAAGSSGIVFEYLDQTKIYGIIFIVLLFFYAGQQLIAGEIRPKGYTVGSGANCFFDIPKVGLKKFETLSGLVVLAPVEKDQCWDAPLPCTPYPNSKLSLRKQGDLRRGFKVAPFDDGDKAIGMH